MWKKLIVLMMVMSIVFTCLSASMALTLIEIQPIEIQPFYTDTSSITAALTIDSSGNASCSGKVKPTSASSSTSITVRLMQKSGNTWSEVKSWSASKTGANGASAGGSVKVTKGYTYQVRVAGKVYNSGGTLLESPTKNSNEKSY